MLAQRRLHRVAKTREALFRVLEMDPQRTPPVLDHRVEVAASLRVLHDAEGIGVARNGDVLGVVAGDLQEDPRVWTALVSLSRRVLEAWAESQAGSGERALVNQGPQFVERASVRLVAFDIGEKRDVVAPLRISLREMATQIPRQRVVPSELGAVLRIRIEREAVFAEQRLLLGQLMRLLIFRAERARLRLARLDVGLVEGVDAEHRAGDGGRDLEAEELLAQVRNVPHDDARD